MPEGDTLHKIAGAMRPLARGETVAGLWLRERGWVEQARGLVVEDVAALGKHLLMSFAGSSARAGRLVAHVHLGMRGRAHGYAPDPDWQPGGEPTLRLELEKRAWLFRRTARTELLRGVEIAQHPVLSRLGPDLLEGGVDLDAIVARARRREPRSVSELLLDQRVACGIGNVYRCEVLFVEGVDPWTPSAALPDATLRRLFARARQLLQGNLGGWRRTTTRRVDGSHPIRLGEPRHWVYGRAGLPCLRCGTRVRGARLGDEARATFWCSRCQPRSD